MICTIWFVSGKVKVFKRKQRAQLAVFETCSNNELQRNRLSSRSSIFGDLAEPAGTAKAVLDRETEMNAALFSLALLASPSLVEISDKVPELRIEALCKATTETDKAMGLALAQSFTDCVRDETSAQQQLGTLWATTKPAVRDECEGEATSVGQSYVDLLTCIQMTDVASAISTTPALRGASKNRNKQ